MDGEAGRPLQQQVREAVRAEMGELFDELRRFVDRRIAELSTEIHATVEMVDFSETNLTQQLQRMHQQLARVVALPAAATRNSGLELEAIVQATEEAANRIMGAAEAIRIAIEGKEPKALVIEQVNEIFEACSFQDLTSQRIHRALDQLKAIDRMLAHMAGQAGLSEESEAPIRVMLEVSGAGPDLAQNEIDRIMAQS
jgi:chemotaxis protein CheZ